MNVKYSVIFPENLKRQRKEISFDRFINRDDWIEFDFFPGEAFVVTRKKFNINKEDEIRDVELHVKQV